MFKQKLQQKIQLRLSPQQIQFVRLLELPAIEMEDRVKQELEENPVLEEGSDFLSERSEADDPGDDENSYVEDSEVDLSLGDYMTEDDIPYYKLAEMHEREDRREDIPFSGGISLQDYLLEQLGLRNLSEREKKIGEYIVGNIDDNGYLRRSLTSITDDLIFKAGEEVSDADVQSVLTVIQDFDPAGTGARNLQECLLLQLEKKRQTSCTQLAITVVKDHFDAFAKKHFDKIRRGLNIDENEMRQILHEITALNPKPGNSMANISDTTVQIMPDFIVETNNDDLTLIMNQRGIPDMHISREYLNMVSDYAKNKANRTAEMREAIQFVKQKLESARWFIDSVKQRQETLQRTMQAIIMLQKDFFLTGDESRLHPMILKDVAKHTGYDISTISRVSNSKYVQTNFGIFPLKFFFSESTQNESGEEISTREVKQIMKEFIDLEDKHSPLTDDVLSAMLKEKGYIIARRTVAKYREQMGIPVARLRKVL
ncbi:MAG: RNA polymerase factor sigma-54 [Tannerella sp.]|jgi:RNA polymerase sigma-54 factor|nr:RNA polymerase factor sigma-54 [Tannerella sp.]